MTIRPATKADTDALLRMAVRFTQEPPYRGRVVAHVQALAANIDYLLTHGYVVVAESDGAVVGMLVAQLFVNPFTLERTANELAWWVDPDARFTLEDARRMVLDFEAWADVQNAPVRNLVAPEGSRVWKLYKRLHREHPYEPLETTWQRRLAA